MLNTPAPFPQPNSWALFERDGRTVVARILSPADAGGQVAISFPDVLTSSGAHHAPLDRLLDATPLDSGEKAELAELSIYLGGLAHPEKSARYGRFEALRLRDIRARDIVDLFARLEGRRFATAATREAHRTFAAAIAAGERRQAA